METTTLKYTLKTAAISLGALLVTILFFTNLNAQTDNKNTATPDPADVKVPMKDARGVKRELVIASAAMLSQEGIVLVFYGTDAEFLEKTKEEFREAVQKGYPVKGIIVADSQTGKSYVDCHTLGIQSNKRGAANGGEVDLILQYGNSLIEELGPRFGYENNSPAPKDGQ